MARHSPAGFALVASRGKWLPAEHLVRLDRKLREVAVNLCPRLIITMPPRHGKSELISRYFPAWYLGTFPERRIILASYEAGFASTWGRKARDLMTELGPRIWNLQVRDDSSASDRWDLLGHQGGMMTAGAGGPLTGKGADLLLIDDPIKNAEEASSRTYRERTWEWFQSTAYTRLEPNGAVILIQTRWHKDDLAGRLLAQSKAGGEHWELLNLPAIAQADDALGRAPGAPLWPERFDLPELQRIKETVGSYYWTAMYQQSPTEPGGNIIKRDWLPPYRELPKIHYVLQSWDCAFKPGKDNDFSAVTTWGLGDTGYYLMDIWRGRLEYPDLLRQVQTEAGKWHPNIVLIEDKASGQSIIQDLARSSRLALKPITPTRDKETRLNAISPLFEAGRVLLPDSHPFLPDFVEELTTFPNGEHDDLVDSTSQALAYLKELYPDGPPAGGEDRIMSNNTGFDELPFEDDADIRKMFRSIRSPF